MHTLDKYSTISWHLVSRRNDTKTHLVGKMSVGKLRVGKMSPNPLSWVASLFTPTHSAKSSLRD